MTEHSLYHIFIPVVEACTSTKLSEIVMMLRARCSYEALVSVEREELEGVLAHRGCSPADENWCVCVAGRVVVGPGPRGLELQVCHQLVQDGDGIVGELGCLLHADTGGDLFRISQSSS